MNITLRQLQAFLAVAELGSFTRAAGRLHLTQSALSVLVAELERSLRLRLLDRTTRRVELTEAGTQFLASAAKAVADLDHAVRHAHQLADRQHGRVTIAAPPLLAATLLPDVIARHRAAFPGIEVNLIDVATDQIIARLRAGETDLALGTFPPDLDGIARTRLMRDWLVALCPRAHPLARARTISWKTLSAHPVITLTRESGIRLLAEQSWLAAGVAIRPAFEVTQVTTAAALAEAGLGVAVLPAYATAIATTGVARPLSEPAVEREIALIHLRWRTLSPAALSFSAFLVEAAGPATRTKRGDRAGARQ